MAWTTFAALTSATGAELDANFGALTNLVNISCSVSGTNTLALTNTNVAATIAAYQQNMELVGIAAATNTGSTTAALGSLAALNVYVDTPAGPVALAGGEIVQNCGFVLIYDAALNTGAGGFHLQTGGGALKNQTVTVAGLSISSNPTNSGHPERVVHGVLWFDLAEQLFVGDRDVGWHSYWRRRDLDPWHFADGGYCRASCDPCCGQRGFDGIQHHDQHYGRPRYSALSPVGHEVHLDGHRQPPECPWYAQQLDIWDFAHADEHGEHQPADL